MSDQTQNDLQRELEQEEVRLAQLEVERGTTLNSFPTI